MFAPLDNFPHGSTFANGLIDGGPGSSAQAAQNAAFGAAGIRNRTAAGTACSLGHPQVVSRVAVRSQARAIEPCLVEEFAGLHVKANGDQTGFTERIGGWPSARTAAEVARDPFARLQVKSVAVAIAVALPILILRRSQRGERNQQQNCGHTSNSRGCAVPRSLAG
jgi:hypothetical protein